MRIAVVTPEFPPITIGGGGIAVEAISSELSRGHQLRVFSGDHADPRWIGPRHRTEHAGYVVLRYPLLPLFTGVEYLKSVVPPNLRSVVDLRRDIAEWAPDVAHVHGCGYAISDLAAWVFRREGVPYLLTDHGLPRSPEERGFGVRFGHSLYASAIMAKTVGAAGEMSAVSRAEAALCEVRTGRRPIVIGNGVSVGSRESGVATSEALERFLTLAERGPVVLAAGRMTPSKGFDVLVDAMSGLSPVNATCLIVGASGDGAYLSLLQEGAAGRTIFGGRVSRQELLSMMARATVVVVPSRWEPFGLVALEGIMEGARVVASNVGGLPDFVRAPYGSLVPPNDRVALRAALEDALGRGRLAGDDWLAARDELLKRTWPVIAQRYEAVLRSLVPGAV